MKRNEQADLLKVNGIAQWAVPLAESRRLRFSFQNQQCQRAGQITRTAARKPDRQTASLSRSCPAEGARFLVKPDPSVNRLFQCLNTRPGGQPRSAVSIRTLTPGQLQISEVLQSVRPAGNDAKASDPAKRLRRFWNSFLSERLSSMERFASAGKPLRWS